MSALLARWFTIDTRTLGLFRIYFGALLLANLWDRLGGFDLVSFYSNEGIFPNHWALFLPQSDGYWSLLLGFSTPGEVRVVVALIALVYVLYLVGWQTRWMQVLALVAYASLNFRFIIIQHGGNVVVSILLLWTAFLPLGARFSVDSLLRSLGLTKEEDAAALQARGWLEQIPRAHVGLAFFGLCFNFAAIYFFNTAHKSGPTWHEGTAVHYVLWQNRIATSIAELVRLHEPGWFSPLLTWGTLVTEGALPVLILSPWLQRWFRPAACVAIWGLHGGIAALSTLGPFSYAMMGFGLLMLQGADFDWVAAKLRRPGSRRTVRLDFASPLQLLGARVLARLDLLGQLTFEAGPSLEVAGPDGKPATGRAAWESAVRALPLGPLYAWLFAVPFVADLLRGGCRLLGRWYLEQPPRTGPLAEGPYHHQVRLAVQLALPALLFAAMLSQLAVENRALPDALRVTSPPPLLKAIVGYGQFRQGWSMFAPDGPRDDSLMVVDATLADGTHLDLLTGQPPDFDAPNHGPFFMNQHWCEVHQRLPGSPQHWRNFKDYLMRLPRLRGWPASRQVTALEVWQLTARAPEPGSTAYTDIQRRRLFDQNL